MYAVLLLRIAYPVTVSEMEVKSYLNELNYECNYYGRALSDVDFLLDGRQGLEGGVGGYGIYTRTHWHLYKNTLAFIQKHTGIYTLKVGGAFMQIGK